MTCRREQTATTTRWILGPDGKPIGVNPSYTANAFNPYLRPTEAWQYDLSLENYFGNVGQFSVAAFYKKFNNYIQYGIFNEDVTNSGVTRTVQVTGPANGKGAKIKGFEVDYQRFFDFLPGVFSGLGIQANFTYVKNSGVPNANLTPVGTPAVRPRPTPGTLGTALNSGLARGLVQIHVQSRRHVREGQDFGPRRLQLALEVSGHRGRLLRLSAGVAEGCRIPRRVDPLPRDQLDRTQPGGQQPAQHARPSSCSRLPTRTATAPDGVRTAR